MSENGPSYPIKSFNKNTLNLRYSTLQPNTFTHLLIKDAFQIDLQIFY